MATRWSAPVPGLRNMWIAEGFSFGITAAGGTGYYLAQMMVNGEAEIDMASLDPRRYGNWMTTEYAARKNEECYDHVFILHHPDEEREACRPLRTAPVYDRQKALGAQFGQVNGWERPIYYGPLNAPEDFDHNSRSFRRGGWWQYAVDEAKAIRETAGLIDATAFTKHVVKGPGATAFLDWFTCNALPKVGRINLTYALTPAGTTRTEYTIVRNGENDYYLVSAGAWTAYDADYLRNVPRIWRPNLAISRSMMSPRSGASFAIAGPNSRKILAELIKDADPATALSNKRFPWLSARKIELGMCPVNAIRVAYTGELGWELHHPIEMQRYLWDQLLKARRETWDETGRRTGAKLAASGEILPRVWQRVGPRCDPAGSRAGPLCRPVEGLPRQAGDAGCGYPFSKCVTVLIDGPADTDPWGKEALVLNGEKIGRLTSGGYSVAFGKQIGMGYVRPDLAVTGQKLQVRMNASFGIV